MHTPHENSIKRFGYAFYAIFLISFAYLVYICRQFATLQADIIAGWPQIAVCLAVILILCVFYTAKGMFHLLYNPRNKLKTNLFAGFIFGLFCGYFLVVYSKHVQNILFTNTFDASDVKNFLLFAVYFGLLICVGLTVLTTLSRIINECSLRGALTALKQRKYIPFEIIPLILIFLSILLLGNEFTQIVPTYNTDLYAISHVLLTLFSAPVMFLSLLAYGRTRGSLAKVCLCIGILMLLWLWFYLAIVNLPLWQPPQNP